MDSPLQWLQANLDLVSFVYGASFVLLGTVILSQPARGSDFRLPKIMWLVAAFGLTQGLIEWLVTWTMVKGDSDTQTAVRLGAEVVSSLFLFEFGRRLLLICMDAESARHSVFHPLGLWLYLPLLLPPLGALWLVPQPLPWVAFWNGYFAGFGGALLASTGLWWYRRRERERLAGMGISGVLVVVAATFLVYGFFAGVIGPRGQFFPASWLNEDVFRELFTVSVVVIQAAVGIVLALALGRLMLVFHAEARRKLQDAFERVSRRHQLILEAAGEGIFLLDQEGVIVFANPAALRLLRYEEAELVGHPFHDAVQHSIADGTPYSHNASPIYAARTSGRTHAGSDEVFWRRDGSRLAVRHTCTPIREEDELLGAVITFSDITERKRLDRLLRDTQQLAKVGGWDIDLTRDELSWTDEMYRIHELPVGVPVSVDDALEHFDQRPRARLQRAMKHVTGAGGSFDLELQLNTVSGRRIWVRVIGRAYLSDGRAYRLAGTLQDVTERRQQERALRENKNFYELILDSVPMHIAYVEADGRIAYVNKSYVEWCGSPRSEILGREVHALLSEDIHEQIRPHLGQVLGGNTTTFRASVQRGEGVCELEVTYLPHRARSGEVLGFFSVVQDITEHKQLEAKLLQAQKMEAVGQLTGGLAHDFNNLLSVILGNLQLLERPLGDDEKLLKKIKAAARAARRGADLTRRLLAFSRGQMLEPKIVDLNAHIRGLDELLRRTLGESVEITTSFADDLWAATVDPLQLENALLNLAINARDAMPEGGQLTIETTNTQLDGAYAARYAEVEPGDYVLVAVTDTGVGMPPEIIEQVFEPFYTTKEVGKGSGLGLSMVYGFVEQSGGHISIYSEVAHGTSVKLYLPRSRTGVVAAPDESGVMRAVPAGNEKILVVEDDDDVRETVVTILGDLGYQIVEAADGNAALDELERHPDVDLLFTDVMMPGGMRGPVLAARAQERNPGLRVLFTTGYAESAVMHRGALVGSGELIGKPYKKDELARKVRTILDKEYDDAGQTEPSVSYR